MCICMSDERNVMETAVQQPITITKVEIDAHNMVAHIRIAESTPLFTSDDLEATTRIYDVMPQIITHTCLGDASSTFKDVMGNTEIAHLLEHVCVELLAQTDRAGDITSGKTFITQEDNRDFVLQFACVDDVLVVAAFASAVWIMNWAFSHAGGTAPDTSAIVSALIAMQDEVGTPQPLIKEVSVPCAERIDTPVYQDALTQEGASQNLANNEEDGSAEALTPVERTGDEDLSTTASETSEPIGAPETVETTIEEPQVGESVKDVEDINEAHTTFFKAETEETQAVEKTPAPQGGDAQETLDMSQELNIPQSRPVRS